MSENEALKLALEQLLVRVAELKALYGFEKITPETYEVFVQKTFEKPGDQKRWGDRIKSFTPDHAQAWLDFCQACLTHLETRGHLNAATARQVFLATGALYFYAQAKPDSQLRIAANTADQLSKLYMLIRGDSKDAPATGLRVWFGHTLKDSAKIDGLTFTLFPAPTVRQSPLNMPASFEALLTKDHESIGRSFKVYLDGLEAEQDTVKLKDRAAKADERIAKADEQIAEAKERAAKAEERAQNYKKLGELMDEVNALYTSINADLKTLTTQDGNNQQAAFLRLAENARKMKVAQQNLDTLNKPFAEEKGYKDTIELTKVTLWLLAKANIPVEK